MKVKVYKLGEDRMARNLVAIAGGEMAYVAELGKWFIHDGERWVPDRERQVYVWAKTICLHASTEALEQVERTQARVRQVGAPLVGLKFSRTRLHRMNSAKTVATVVALAAADPAVLVRTPDDLAPDASR